MDELTYRCGASCNNEIAPYVWQLEHRTREILKLPGTHPVRYCLRQNYTALLEWK